MEQILIIGNGFDLACHLETSYNDFFKWRFEQLFGNINKLDIKNKIRDLTKNFDCELHYPKSKNGELENNLAECFGNKINLSTITVWDYIFLFGDDFFEETNGDVQWQDIEKMIYNVITVALDNNFDKNHLIDHISSLNLNLTFKGENKDNIKIQFYKYIKYFFIKRLCEPKKDTAYNALLSLNKFENIFSQFILEEERDKVDYKKNAQELLMKLYNLANNDFKGIISNGLDTCNVLSFNYTLRATDKLEISVIDREGHERGELCPWTNIHGIVANENDIDKYIRNDKMHISPLNKPEIGIPTPIFGIDNHDILKDNKENDLRMIFTKSFRTIDSYVNNIWRRRFNLLKRQIDVITIYGHSLGKADYSYFETIFDSSNLYDSSTCLQVYYYAEKNRPEENLLEKRRIEAALINLLTDYGKTLSNGHGENIVNKMVLENRIEVIPTTSLN